MQSSTAFLQQQMEENGHLANQAERMRLIVATGNLCLATVLQVGIAFLNLDRRALFPSGWMIILGIYGILAGKKLYERETYHRRRVRKLRAKLSSFYADTALETLFKEVEDEHRCILSWIPCRTPSSFQNSDARKSGLTKRRTTSAA